MVRPCTPAMACRTLSSLERPVCHPTPPSLTRFSRLPLANSRMVTLRTARLPSHVTRHPIVTARPVTSQVGVRILDLVEDRLPIRPAVSPAATAIARSVSQLPVASLVERREKRQSRSRPWLQQRKHVVPPTVVQSPPVVPESATAPPPTKHVSFGDVTVHEVSRWINPIYTSYLPIAITRPVKAATGIQFAELLKGSRLPIRTAGAYLARPSRLPVDPVDLLEGSCLPIRTIQARPRTFVPAARTVTSLVSSTLPVSMVERRKLRESRSRPWIKQRELPHSTAIEARPKKFVSFGSVTSMVVSRWIEPEHVFDDSAPPIVSPRPVLSASAARILDFLEGSSGLPLPVASLVERTEARPARQCPSVVSGETIPVGVDDLEHFAAATPVWGRPIESALSFAPPRSDPVSTDIVDCTTFAKLDLRGVKEASLVVDSRPHDTESETKFWNELEFVYGSPCSESESVYSPVSSEEFVHSPISEEEFVRSPISESPVYSHLEELTVHCSDSEEELQSSDSEDGFVHSPVSSEEFVRSPVSDSEWVDSSRLEQMTVHSSDLMEDFVRSSRLEEDRIPLFEEDFVHSPCSDDATPGTWRCINCGLNLPLPNDFSHDAVCVLAPKYSSRLSTWDAHLDGQCAGDSACHWCVVELQEDSQDDENDEYLPY
ncbi:hypothetical protein N7520_009464 [Penicillium odoratum]|uniref:uncharacterized protein n=1 Tax=Penicillium odoratum TaxID=1167516 RepID=UPI0025465917|nr:uncharacterized protein N7520_009464 [Penicillium odoratum]KAJ5752547.1 hypothetical protein N7520_009464 [Penicillium odoratum]